jgi:hypothetical protein
MQNSGPWPVIGDLMRPIADVQRAAQAICLDPFRVNKTVTLVAVYSSRYQGDPSGQLWDAKIVGFTSMTTA